MNGPAACMPQRWRIDPGMPAMFPFDAMSNRADGAAMHGRPVRFAGPRRVTWLPRRSVRPAKNNDRWRHSR
ncbi:hypothetical protein BCEP4_1130015 [Burkholderia cepacia]|nr:hypothetical protein BCEP4_1130015 [Burkholderia cepacia]